MTYSRRIILRVHRVPVISHHRHLIVPGLSCLVLLGGFLFLGVANGRTASRYEIPMDSTARPFSDEPERGILQAPIGDCSSEDPKKPDIFEPDDSFTSPTDTEFPIDQCHSLHLSNDVDWVRFYAMSNFTYAFETMHVSTNIDTVIQVYRQIDDQEVEYLFEKNSNGNEMGELVEVDFPSNGLYQVRISQAEDEDYIAANYRLLCTVTAGPPGINVCVIDDLTRGLFPLIGAKVDLHDSNANFLDSRTVSFLTGSSLNFNVPPGLYIVGVTPPQDYVFQKNPINNLGNPRPVVFTISYTHSSFTFVPVARVTGVVQDHVLGPIRPVENAPISLVGTSRTGRVHLFQTFPWDGPGTPWVSSPNGGLPSNVYIPSLNDYGLSIHKQGYTTWSTNFSNLSRGQLIDLGNLVLSAVDANTNQIPDPWEYEHFTNLVAATEDRDRDFADNFNEYQAGTNPQDSNSVFRLPNVRHEVGGVMVTWSVEQGREYTVYSSRDLLSTNRLVEAGPFTPPLGMLEMSWTDTNSVPLHKIYLVEVLQP